MAGTDKKDKQESQQEVQQEQKAENSTDIAVYQEVEGIDFSSMGFSDEELAGLTGLDGMDATEIKIPYAELMSKDPTNPLHKKGDIIFPDGTIIHGWNGESLEHVTVLKVSKVRVMFPTPFNPQNSFDCRSIDGISGHTDGKYPGQACSTCQYSKYPKTGGASPCRDQRLLLIEHPNGSLFHILVGGVSVGEWKTFMAAQIMYLLKKAKVLAAFDLTLGVKTVTTNFGPFPALDFKLSNPKQPFYPAAKVKASLEALDTYKKFEKEYLEQAAVRTQEAMVSGGEEAPEAAGPNGDMF